MKLAENKYADGNKEFVGVKGAFADKQEFVDAVCSEFEIESNFQKPSIDLVEEVENVAFSDTEQIGKYEAYVLKESDLIRLV